MWTNIRSLPVLRRRSMRRKREKKNKREREIGERCLQNTRFDDLVSMDLCTEKRGLCMSVWILKERKEGRRMRERKAEKTFAGRLLNGRFMCFCAYATHRMCIRVYVCTYSLSSWRTTTYEWWWRATTFLPSFSFRPPARHWLKSLFRRQQHLPYL